MEEERENKSSDGHVSNLSVTLLLLAGFCGVIGLLATAIIGIPLSFALASIALAAICLPCGFSRLRKKEEKVKTIQMGTL